MTIRRWDILSHFWDVTEKLANRGDVAARMHVHAPVSINVGRVAASQALSVEPAATLLLPPASRGTATPFSPFPILARLPLFPLSLCRRALSRPAIPPYYGCFEKVRT